MKLEKISSFALFLLIWYVVSPLLNLPYPHEVFFRLASLLVYPEPVLGKTLLQHSFASLLRVLVASSIAFSISIPLGVISGWSERIRTLIMPVVEVIRPIRRLAWIPLAYILFASFPETIFLSQLFIVFVGAFFPSVISVFDAARNTPENLLKWLRFSGLTV